MGFDVDAFFPDGDSDSSRPAVAAAFADAKRWLLENAIGCDGFLDLGSLDCPLSIEFLENALGRKCGPPDWEIWLPEELAELAKNARWPNPDTIATDQRWAYWSARKFVEICVKHGLGIWFS